MSTSTNYFKTGMFIIVGLALLIAAVLILGAGNVFKQYVYMETYIDESVGGLSEGSAVKFKGVQIGRVKSIGFTMHSYTDFMDSKYRYVYVLCELDKHYFKKMSPDEVKKLFAHEVDMGLRARLFSVGLTGLKVLELDYVNPEDNPQLAIGWTPEHIYVPSAPSMMSRVESAVAAVSSTLRDVKAADIAGTVNSIRDVARNVNRIMTEANATGIQSQLVGSLNQLHMLLRSINDIISSPATRDILPQAQSVMSRMDDVLYNVNTILESSREDVISTVRDVAGAARSINNATTQITSYMNSPDGQQALKDIGSTINNVANATRKVSSSAARLNNMITRVNAMLAGQQTNIRVIMENARALMENLRELSDEAKRYPSGVLFGQPPGQARPEGQEQ